MTVDNIPQGEPREIATRNVFKVLTEEIISRGESPRLPRSNNEKEAKHALRPSVSSPTSYGVVQFGSGLTHGAFGGTGQILLAP